MTAQQIADEMILCGQSEVLEWWLVTPYMAELLKENGEVILAAYDCCWWGRQASGQALYMDWVIQKIAEQMG